MQIDYDNDFLPILIGCLYLLLNVCVSAFLGVHIVALDGVFVFLALSLPVQSERTKEKKRGWRNGRNLFVLLATCAFSLFVGLFNRLRTSLRLSVSLHHSVCLLVCQSVCLYLTLPVRFFVWVYGKNGNH